MDERTLGQSQEREIVVVTYNDTYHLRGNCWRIEDSVLSIIGLRGVTASFDSFQIVYYKDGGMILEDS